MEVYKEIGLCENKSHWRYQTLRARDDRSGELTWFHRSFQDWSPTWTRMAGAVHLECTSTSLQCCHWLLCGSSIPGCQGSANKITWNRKVSKYIDLFQNGKLFPNIHYNFANYKYCRNCCQSINRFSFRQRNNVCDYHMVQCCLEKSWW